MLWMLSEKVRIFDEKSDQNQSDWNQSDQNQSNQNQSFLKSLQAPSNYF